MTANLDTVTVGDILLLTLEGPEEILAEHGAGALVPQGDIEDGWNTAAEVTEGGPELVESGDGYRVYQYVVPEYQPVGPSYNEAGKLAEDFRNVALPGSKLMLNFDSSVTIADSPDGVIHRFISEAVHLTVTEQEPEEAAGNTPLQDDENEGPGPTLTVDRNELHIDDFVGQPDDGAGVRHTVEGLEPGLDVTYSVQGPDSIEGFSGEGSMDEDGVMTFVVHGFEHSTPSIYIGDHTTTVQFNDQDGNPVGLSDQFTVVGDSAAVVVPAQVEPAQLGTDLAKTGVSNTALVLIAAALLVVGILIAAFARHRRLSRAQL